MSLLRDALDETGLDRELGGRERERLARHLHADPIDLEQDAARPDARDPELRRSLAGTHAHLKRLFRYRHVRIHPDPDPAGALHVPGERPTRRFDLARGDAVRLQRLKTILAEIEIVGAGRKALDSTLVRLAKLGAHRLQHGSLSFLTPLARPRQPTSRRGRPLSPSAIRLSCAIGSCSRISPLKIQTLTPQVP